MPNQRHEAFSIEYPNLSSELFTEVVLFNPADMDNYVKTFALWDTGATISSIAPGVAKKLGLEPIDSVLIEGVNSLEKCDQILVHVGLPNKLIVPNIKPSVCNFGPPDLEFIIGMDIIKFGDFMIANSRGKTLFSFAAPPLPVRINLVNQADHINRMDGK
jgi:hypothetical protein